MSVGRTRYAADKLRLRIFEAQGGRCCYCGQRIYVRGHKSQAKFPHRTPSGKARREFAATFEHLKRLADGGTHRVGNLALACQPCNSMRGDMDWLTYKSLRMGEDVAA